MNINGVAVDMERAGQLSYDLNGFLERLNSINDGYPRYCGTMIMVCDETEDQIMGIVVQAEQIRSELAELPIEALAELTDWTGQEYKDFLDEVKEVLENNRREVEKAKDFLAKYYNR